MNKFRIILSPPMYSIVLILSDLDFDMSVKKKKKKKQAILLDDDMVDDSGYATSDSWTASERDYTYEEVSVCFVGRWVFCVYANS